MRLSPRARLLLGASVIFFSASFCTSAAHPPQPAAQQPSRQPTTPAASQSSQIKAPPAAPAAPLSTHYPILLLVEGKDDSWSLRIGQKGPERLDRNGYPPIPLEPVEVVREGTTDTWTYHAKDSQTGATVAIHLTREACTGNNATIKYGFSASVDHAQIGSLEGCARIATELFPKINNETSDDDDDDDTKDKPAPPTITHYKSPFSVAYMNAGGKLIFKRGTYPRSASGMDASQPSISPDGKRLVYTVEETGKERAIFLYDWTTSRSSELLTGGVQQAFWSPDGTRIAFLKFDGSKWQVWIMAVDAPDKAALVYPGDISNLEGWADTHTVLADDLQNLYWIGDDGAVKQTLSSTELYGKGQFGMSSANTVRIHPLNPDLLLVSAELTAPLPVPATPAAETGGKQGTKKDEARPAMAFFLYEIRSQRRVILSPPNLTCSLAEWSRDGLQIFFTGRDLSSNATATYRMFWDGTSQRKYLDGYGLVIGE